MLLQPLLENSIRHGMGSSRSALELGIGVSRDQRATVIRVDDNGLGFDRLRQSAESACTNIASRLAYMYGDRGTYSIGRSRPKAERARR